MKLVRPLVAATAAASLLLAGAAGAAVKVPACTSYADPTGDTTIGGAVPANQDALDLTKVTLGYKDKTLTSTFDVAKYAAASSYSDGVRFDASFTTPGGKVITLFGQHSRTEAAESQAFAFQGIKVDGTYQSGSSKLVTVSDAGNSFILKTGLGDIEAAAGEKLMGKKLGTLAARSWGFYEAVSSAADDATGAVPFTVATCA